MARIWHNAKGDGWTATELRSVARLKSGAVEHIDDVEPLPGSESAILYAAGDQSTANWVLVAQRSAGVWINDSPLVTGIRTLNDRDAIRVGGLQPSYFSAERLAEIVRYPAAECVYCPRCKLEIAEGDAAVCCPQCNNWFHENATDGRTCWSYADTCALCDQATDEGGFRFTPEQL